MSDDYVSKEKALEICEMFRAAYEGSQSRIDEVIGRIANCIEGQPTASVKPVVKGEWKQTGNHSAVCTACGKTTFVAGVDRTGKALIHKGLFHFCPNCGADMRKEANK